MNIIEIYIEIWKNFWVFLGISAAIVGGAGSMRKIGFLGGFVCAVLLTPLGGLIVVLNSPETPEEKERQLNEKKKAAAQQEAIGKSSNSKSEALERLARLRAGGDIDEAEFLKLKAEVLGTI